MVFSMGELLTGWLSVWLSGVAASCEEMLFSCGLWVGCRVPSCVLLPSGGWLAFRLLLLVAVFVSVVAGSFGGLVASGEEVSACCVRESCSM